MSGFDAPICIKTPEELKIMAEGGKKLRQVKNELEKMVAAGVNALQIEEKACELIAKTGGKPSFKMVPGYHWATCVNVNSGLVHGIPKKNLVFQKGDLVSIDVGLFYKGFHTDTSISVGIDLDPKTQKFFDTGMKALAKSIKMAVNGNKICDISKTMEGVLKGSGYSPVMALVGHGVGRTLHEEPAIPCFGAEKREYSPEIKNGMALAIEVMYTLGSPDLVMEEDGWTIGTRDGKISALFEETVAVTPDGPLVLT
jgi:methionyl aminopeptidase